MASTYRRGDEIWPPRQTTGTLYSQLTGAGGVSVADWPTGQSLFLMSHPDVSLVDILLSITRVSLVQNKCVFCQLRVHYTRHNDASLCRENVTMRCENIAGVIDMFTLYLCIYYINICVTFPRVSTLLGGKLTRASRSHHRTYQLFLRGHVTVLTTITRQQSFIIVDWGTPTPGRGS